MRYLSLAFALFFLPAASFAQTTPAAPAPTPAPASDSAAAEKAAGGVTREDYVKRAADRAAARFDREDLNHDGVLTREESAKYRQAHARPRRSTAKPAQPEATPPKQQ